ncbi:hypothetical protein [Solicola sp. PLA-1-18]|uniref:hypothetical protein n=1 Tax=Solicola sp. PLA-1-18 TaxID=3380532 RepID=UPI003B768280
MSPGTLWYAGYGSNTLVERLRTYLAGADASSRFGAHPATAEPFDGRTCWTTSAHPLYFAGRSVRWDGAVAFLGLEPRTGVTTRLRTYELTPSQLVHVATVENNVPDLAWDGDVTGIEVGAAHLLTLPSGLDPARAKYDAVLRLPDHEDRPVVTLTTSRDLEPGVPGEAYRQVIADGLADSDLAPAGVEAYLDAAVRLSVDGREHRAS